MKKVNGDAAESHYTVVDPTTGEINILQPEYTTMSRRPGIGSAWYRQFKSDVYPSDEVIIRGRRMKPPKAYDKMFQHDEETRYLMEIRGNRVRRARKHEWNNTPERLRVRERVTQEKVKQLKRTVE